LGDENSLAGTTKAHKHTSPASDGGFLETTETGVTNMSEGSIGYYDSSSVLTELTSGSSGEILQMGASLPAWASVSTAPTLNLISVTSGTEFSTSSASFVDVTGFTGSLSSGSGMALCMYQTSTEQTSAGYVRWSMSVSGDQSELLWNSPALGQNIIQSVADDLSSQTCKVQLKVYTGGLVFYVQRDGYNGLMNILEIS